jgi:hypothetical protein
MWFPGAHADVGGGYADSNELPGISLNWMLGLLAKSYKFNTLPQVKEDAKGLAHWPICDFVNKISNDEEDRKPEDWADLREPQFHPSIQERKNAGEVPICIQKKIYRKLYPVSSAECSTLMSVKNIFSSEKCK